ncbi:MAG TPA: prolyl oligopeptidase family serine peptidase [Burkholderiaceae bacterium]|nr:prolyl oligopeptidase family serine peptidase [Burkholderiaceae bacterium]
MFCSFVRGWRIGVSVAAGLCAASVQAQSLPTIDDFFRTPALSEPSLSPSGRYLAVVTGDGNVGARLGVIDLDDRKNSRVVARFDGSDPTHPRWLNDERLIFEGRDTDEASALRRNFGMWAVDRDGSNLKPLGRGGFGGTTSNGSDDVIVYRARWSNLGDLVSVVPLTLNTRTGVALEMGPWPDAHVVDVLFDVSGKARVTVARFEGRQRIYWRAASETQWRLVSDEAVLKSPGIDPLWVDADELYVGAPAGKEGVRAIYKYDLALKRLEPEPLLKIDGFDYLGSREVEHGSGKTLGIHYEADAAGSYWLDPWMKAAQTAVDALLPGTINKLLCTKCVGAPRLLVSSYSDRQPPIYYIFDTGTKKLDLIGASRPWINPAQMATQEFVRIAARDGRSIPTYITSPRGKSDAPRPAVVLVHGGPTVRGNVWGWNAEAQFLASRGYVVIEPEFRGSYGFGWEHLSAGFGQWGQAMQDDVTDATLWAVKSAHVDAGRICIAGASYGGYAAMMGLVREPQIYQCGVNWVGITDPALMFDLPYSDISEDEKRFGLPVLIGDPKKDPELFRKISPVAQAARITKPVLMAYGSFDRRVPMEHGKQLRSALAGHNKDVEWVVYSYEGHGWGSRENRNDFWTRVEKFLERNLNGAGSTASAGADTRAH